MNARRLVALSTTAAVLAACSSGGGASSAPRPTPSTGSGSTSHTKHPANTKLTLKFSSSFLRLKKAQAPAKAASTKRRKPSYIDPTNNNGNYLEVEVYNSTQNNSYMALIDYPINTSQASQTIPLYLEPGYDYITVQEFGGLGYLNGIAEEAGFLLAQGTANLSVSEATTNTLGVTLQLVLGTAEYYQYTSPTGQASYLHGSTASSIAILTDAVADTVAGYFVQQGQETNYPLCFNQNQHLYFLPTDDLGGTNAFYDNPAFSATNAQPSGLPYATYSPSFPSGGSTAFIPSTLGGYTVNFDPSGDPITVNAYFPSGVVLDPTNYGPLDFTDGELLTIAGTSYPTYSVEIGETGVGICSPGSSPTPPPLSNSRGTGPASIGHRR